MAHHASALNALTVTALTKVARQLSSTERRGRLVLDRDYRILEAETSTGFLDEHVGECLWDAAPLSAETWLPTYRRAWESGRATGVGFQSGILHRATMVVSRDRMTVAVEWEEIARLDVSNVRTARQTLNEVLAQVEAEERRVAGRDRRSRSGTLRVVPEPAEARPD